MPSRDALLRYAPCTNSPRTLLSFSRNDKRKAMKILRAVTTRQNRIYQPSQTAATSTSQSSVNRLTGSASLKTKEFMPDAKASLTQPIRCRIYPSAIIKNTGSVAFRQNIRSLMISDHHFPQHSHITHGASHRSRSETSGLCTVPHFVYGRAPLCRTHTVLSPGRLSPTFTQTEVRQCPAL